MFYGYKVDFPCNIMKSIENCPECNEEAVRVIEIMPPWKPGKQNGKPVSVYFNMPINFTIR